MPSAPEAQEIATISNGQIAESEVTWLNKDLFEDLIRANVPEFRKIVQFATKSEHGSGESPPTNVQRVHIKAELKDGKTRSLSYVLKTPSTSADTNALFKKENTVHQELLPAFEALYKKAGKELKFSATSFKFKGHAKSDYVLLEDLRPKGYKHANRLQGFDMHHTKVVLEKLAAYHAASVVFFERSGLVPQIYTKPSLAAAHMKDFTQQHVPSNRKFQESLRSYNLYEFEDEIKSYHQRFVQNFSKSDKVDMSEFNVLLHGHCCSHNMLFQHDAFGIVKDTVLVDFQIATYGSPAKDLLYLLLSSTRLEEKLKYFDYYIKYYHEQLVANLKLLNYSKAGPSLTDLHLAVLKYSFWGFVAITKILPFTLLETKGDLNLLAPTAVNRELLIQIYSNPLYAQHIQLILPWMKNRGYLEE